MKSLWLSNESIPHLREFSWAEFSTMNVPSPGNECPGFLIEPAFLEALHCALASPNSWLECLSWLLVRLFTLWACDRWPPWVDYSMCCHLYRLDGALLGNGAHKYKWAWQIWAWNSVIIIISFPVPLIYSLFAVSYEFFIYGVLWPPPLF